MSNRQAKVAARQAEQHEFLKERRQLQIAVFESNFNVGLNFYQENKDKMSEEEVALIEAEIDANRKLLEELKAKWDA
jgi:cob(I)alamin adenosyltransferase